MGLGESRMEEAGLDGYMSKLPAGPGGLDGPQGSEQAALSRGWNCSRWQPMVSLWRTLSGGSLANAGHYIAAIRAESGADPQCTVHDGLGLPRPNGPPDMFAYAVYPSFAAFNPWVRPVTAKQLDSPA